MKIRPWIEAMRLRTLPVSVSGVVVAAGLAVFARCFNIPVFVLCTVFAVLSQIASNFANEYYDYRDGLDRPGREGPRRGVTEGDISPRAMAYATVVTLVLACLVGCSLIYYGGWWLIPAGILIALGVVAYSAGPYPLSRHSLGEVAVVLFFGIIPVNLTFYIMDGGWSLYVILSSISVGLLGADILIVNNYRDADDDRAVGKITLAVRVGRKPVWWLYLLNGYMAVALMMPLWSYFGLWWLILPAVFLSLHTFLWWRIGKTEGSALNPMLGMTAMAMLLYSLMFIAMVAANC